MKDTYQSHGTLEIDGKSYRIARLGALSERGIDLERLPFVTKILLENLLRREDGESVTCDDIEAVARWKPNGGAAQEIAFMPARVLLQDFTGVPAVVDLAAMRDAFKAMGGDPASINPLEPVELVIDHSVQVDRFGFSGAEEQNTEIEFQRNHERYLFLRWGQNAFENFKVVPPTTGIVHQVNLEYLARGVVDKELAGQRWAYPDTLVGTDSHTTMINGLGVLGWGVGGIEAEAAMLGQPISMLIPEVVGFRLKGGLSEGVTATDLVLTITQMLRAKGVVGKFVEFFGEGLAHLSLADRATIANMAPEYGATCGIFPIDDQTIDYLRFTGRDEHRARLTEAYAKAQGLWGKGAKEAEYSDLLELDLSRVETSLAGPKRPQDRLTLGEVRTSFEKARAEARGAAGSTSTSKEVSVELESGLTSLHDGSLVIAAITSCTNTSNPSVMIAAGLVAKKANALGIKSHPAVKTSLAPGSRVVTDYLAQAGLLGELEQQGFFVVGYGCTTCIGNSGPLLKPVAQAIKDEELVVASVLSGNRNFEGRVHALVRANYLASPPLVVAYALAGRVDLDLSQEALGQDLQGRDVFLADVWPTTAEVQAILKQCVTPEQYRARYADVYAGPAAWQALEVPSGATYAWDEASTYVKSPPFFDGLSMQVGKIEDLHGARCLVLAGDSITTDHISPAGAIGPESPAGLYLRECGVEPKDFNSYGSRRGNHEVMMRGTFANVRMRNSLTPGVEGSSTLYFGAPGSTQEEATSIYDAAMRYKAEGVPTIVLAGKEYGTGSSRDWAAKGPMLLGVRAVIAESYERIHRSNLVGMGVFPLEFPKGQSAAEMGLSGRETFSITGLEKLFAQDFQGGANVRVEAKTVSGETIAFDARLRIDTPQEMEYVRHGGILQYVLRRLARG